MIYSHDRTKGAPKKMNDPRIQYYCKMLGFELLGKLVVANSASFSFFKT